MDWEAFALGVASGAIVGIIVGIVIGRNNDLLARLRFRDEQRYFDSRDTLDRAVRIFNARVDFVIAAMGTQIRAASYKDPYLELWKNDRFARPEEHVADEVWAVWMRAEEEARDASVSPRDRQLMIESAREEVLSWMAAQRAKLLK